jgi:glutathione S-transferase
MRAKLCDTSRMITLYKFTPAWGLPDVSPFCTKAETYLRMAGWQYESKVGDSRKAPKGKLPYIEHEGRKVCDSTAIIDYLEARAVKPMDAGLSARDKAVSVAMQAMFEEQLYFINSWRRWAEPAGWAVYQPVMADSIAQMGVPRFMSNAVSRLVRSKVIKALNAQGTGRHSGDEINALGIKLISAVSDWLADQPYMLGEEPHTLDATAYAFLIGIANVPIEGPVKAHLLSKANLVGYCERMKERYWAG